MRCAEAGAHQTVFSAQLSTWVACQVPTAVVEAAASPADLRRYRQYALRSYVEDNRKLTW